MTGYVYLICIYTGSLVIHYEASTLPYLRISLNSFCTPNYVMSKPMISYYVRNDESKVCMAKRSQ